MAVLLLLLLVTALLVVAAASWKRLLGLAVSRFAHGRAFRLTVGEFFFAGLADVRLQLHVGPVREVRVSRLGLGLASGEGGAGGAWPLQALLSGQLLLPVSLHGVRLRLAPPPRKPAPEAAPAVAPPAAAGAAAAGRAGGAPPAGDLPGSSSGASKKARTLRGPLALLAYVPLRFEGLTVLDEERGVQVTLQLASLSLQGAQRLLLEGLVAGLVPEGGLAGGSAPSSPSKRQAASASALPGQATFLQVERLQLEHQHDGSFSLQQVQLHAAGAPAGGVAPAGLQRLSLELGAVSLTVGRQLLVWAQQQQAAAAESKRLRAAERPPPAALPKPSNKRDRLMRLLALLPREAELTADSCSAISDSGSGELPLAAAFGLRGIHCRLARAAAPAAEGSGHGGAALVSVAAAWQQLAISLGAAGGSQPLPSALAMSSSAAEWSLEVADAARSGIGGGGGASSGSDAQSLSVAGQVSIGALNTDVCHPAVQPLAAQLREALAAMRSSLRPAAAQAGAAEPSSGAGATKQVALLPQRAPPLLAEWRVSIQLGDGSRLLFTDAAGRCCWSSGLAACRLAARGGGSGASPAAVSGTFEVVGIEMHAVATAQGSSAGEQPAAAATTEQQPPPQMLAAKLLRVEVEHAAGQQQQQLGAGASAAATAVDASTSGVHLLLQQQQLATLASVVVSLLPPPKEHPSTPEEAAAAADSLLHAASLAAVAAAAAAVAPTSASKRRARLPRLSFACSDTLVLLPTTLAVPAEHAASGQLLLLPAAPALVVSSLSGGLGSGGIASLAAGGCCLLYCEGPASQCFPSSTDSLKEHAKAAVLSVDEATFQQSAATAAALPADASVGARLELGTVTATADGDALLCLAAVADSAAQQLAGALAASPRVATPPRRRRRSTHEQPPRQQLAISLAQLRVAQPLCPGRDMALEISAVRAVLGAQQGCQHSVSTSAALLTIDSKPVLRWRSLAASLALPEPAAGHMPARALPAALPVQAGVCGEQAEAQGAGCSFDAYQRARLEAWLEADAATAPDGSAADAAASAAAAAALGTGPASVLDATVSGIELVVPHDGEPGPSQRYCELYLKALETAMQQHLRRFKQRRRSADGFGDPPGGEALSAGAEAAPPPRRRSLFPMQINLDAADVALRFEHHPLEAWLATRGPLLRQMAVQQHLWGEVAATVQPADSASPLHAAMVENAFTSVARATQQAWDGLMQEQLQLYRSKLRRMEGQQQEQCAGSARGSSGGGANASAAALATSPAPDLMLLSCSRLRGLAVLCAGGPEARAAAEAQIAAVDPPSQGVPMSKVLKLHADVAAADFTMRLAGTSRPFVGAAGARLSGTAAVARQAAAPPQTTERRMPVGAHRSAPIPVTVKGSRPVFKFYTDLQLETEALSVCHSQGLDPALALVGLAGKRLAPGDPDKTAPRPPPIPWWDDLRYMWRGRVGLAVQRFGLTLGCTNDPDIRETSERMEVEARDLRGRLLSGDYEATMADLHVTLHRSAGVQQLGGTLLALPFVHAPRASFRLGVDWKLPQGRPPSDHHLFPLTPPPPGELQGPVHAGVLYKSESYNITLHAELGGADLGAAPGAAAAVGFLGGHQVQWMKQYVALMQRMPPQLRQVSRRGTFFWRKPPAGGAPKKSIGKILHQLVLRIGVSPLEIAHFAADPDDPSHGIRLKAPACTYAATYLLNQPLPSFLKLPPHAKRSRRPEATRSVTVNMDVTADAVTVHRAAAAASLSDDEGPGGPSLTGGLRRSGSNGASALLAASRGATPRQGGAAAAPALPAGGGSPHSGGGSHVSWAPGLEEEEAGDSALLGLLEQPSLLDDLFAPAAATREQQPIISAGSVGVTQDPLAPAGAPTAVVELADALVAALEPQGSRPLRVLISDCRVHADQESRDAVWGAVEHLIAAFTSSGSQQRHSLSAVTAAQALAHSPSPSPSVMLTTSPSMPWCSSSPAAQLKRQMSESESQRATPQPTPGATVAAEAAALPPMAPGGHRRTGSADGTLPTPGGGAGGAAAMSTPAAHADSSNELLSLLLEQQAAQRGAVAGGAGDEGDAGGEPASPALLHPGVEELEEEEEEPLSSPADDRHGQLRYIVEVAGLQINCEAAAARGRLLLAARSGRLRGMHIPDTGVNVTALLMEEVSAYVTHTDVDPDAPLLWLTPTPTGYQVPEQQLPVRRVCDPIQISLRHSKMGSNANPRRRSALSSRGSRHRSPGTAGFGASGRGEELLLRVPEVAAALDSREFEVLIDVVTMLQSSGPTVETVGAEAHLLAELEGDEVEEARRLYALLRQQLLELRLASLELRTSLGLQPFATSLAAAAGAGGAELPPLAVTHFLVADSADFVAVQFSTAAELSVAMREHLAAASAAATVAEAEPGGVAGGGEASHAAAAAGPAPPSPSRVPLSPLPSPSPVQLASHARWRQELEDALEAAAKEEQAQQAAGGGALSASAGAPAGGAAGASASALRVAEHIAERQREQAQALLLRWVEQQEGGAFEAVDKSKETLLALKVIARKRQQKHSASRVLLAVDRVVWRMCTPSRDPFMQITIRRWSLDKFKQKDHSGFAKFAIHRIEVLETRGTLGAGPGIGAGVIMSVWNPDASWERDDMLRVVMSMGVPTQTHVIYDHLDVILHPIAFHLTEALAVAAWEYFFPREDEAKARAAADFARSVAVPAAAAARHRRSATALPELAASQQGSPIPGSPSKRMQQAWGEGSQAGSGGQSPMLAGTPRAAGIVNAGWRSAPTKLARRSASGGAGEALAAAGSGAALSRQGTGGGAEWSQAAAEAEAAAAAAGSLASFSQQPFAQQLQRPSASGGLGLYRASATGGGPPQLERASGAAGGRLYRPLSSHSLAPSEDASARPHAATHRKVRFVHVKINRAHCRATYEGYPLTFTDLKLVLDNRTYASIEGRWRDLFNKMKWDTVKSVVKSVAGLQGRKFKELLPEGYGGEEGEGGGRRKPGLFRQLQQGLKGRREDGASGEAALSREELREQHNRRMLFGDAPPVQRRAALPPAPPPAAGPLASGGGGTLPPAAPAAPPPAAGGSPVAQQQHVQQQQQQPSSVGVSPGASPMRQSVDEVAGAGEHFAAPPRGPLGAGAFGSGRALLVELPAEPSLEDGGPLSSAAAAAGGRGGADAAAAALLGVAGEGGGGGSSVRQAGKTPRWAKQLASKAQKGLTKLRDSLQE